MVRQGDEIILYEDDFKWWYFWLHPYDAYVMSHYGCICYSGKFLPTYIKKALKIKID